MANNLNFLKKLILPMTLKGAGMIISFGSVLLIINKFGLEIFGQYAQSLSLLLFLSGIAAYGYPQSIFRDSALMNFLQKKNLFNQMLLLTFYFSILISPIIFFYFYLIDDLAFNDILLIFTLFLIMASSRLRFSLLRTTDNVQFAEVPEQIIKPLIIVFFILIFPNDSITDLYLALFFGLSGALIANFLFIKKFYAFPSSLKVDSKLIKINIKNTNTQLWLSNGLVLFKDFIELFMIGMLFGDLISGEYKLVLQIYVVLMSVFNTMALINSHSFAKLIASKNYSDVNNKAYSEMIPSLLLLILVISFLTLSEILFNVSQYLKLSDIAVYSIIVYMIFSIFNIAIGPVSQLLLHSRQISKLILMTLIRIVTVFSSVYISSLIGIYQLLFFVLFIVFVDSFVLLYASKSLNKSIGFISPIFQLYNNYKIK